MNNKTKTLEQLHEEVEAVFAKQFMKPEMYHGDFTEYDDSDGDRQHVPSDYYEYSKTHSEVNTLWNHYGIRLSASGYMDATEWSAFEIEEEALQYLLDTYDNEG